MKTKKALSYQMQIEDIMTELGMDFSNLQQIGDLIEIKEKIVRGHIIMTHTYLDYLITEKINKTYLKIGNINIQKKIIKNIKIRVFNHQIMEKLSFTEKLEILIKLSIVSDEIYKIIQRINTIRNSLAHIFAFEQSSRHQNTGIAEYNNYDIMSIKGIEAYNKDYNFVLQNL